MFHVACTAPNGEMPSTLTSRARRIVSPWRGPLTESPTTRPSRTDLHQLLEHGAVFQDTALKGGRVDLVQIHVGAEERPALAELATERRQRVIFHLLWRDVHAPLSRIGIPPLRADRELGSLTRMRADPIGEELLGSTVRPGGVHVAHAEREGGIEDIVGASTQCAHVALRTEVVRAAEIDVGGPAQRGQAETDRGNHETGRPERTSHHRRGWIVRGHQETS